jgi:hypothetical protein
MEVRAASADSGALRVACRLRSVLNAKPPPKTHRLGRVGSMLRRNHLTGAHSRVFNHLHAMLRRKLTRLELARRSESNVTDCNRP